LIPRSTPTFLLLFSISSGQNGAIISSAHPRDFIVRS
jgi:hypothetical protein